MISSGGLSCFHCSWWLILLLLTAKLPSLSHTRESISRPPTSNSNIQRFTPKGCFRSQKAFFLLWVYFLCVLNKGQRCTLVTNGNALRAGREDDTFLSYASRSSHFIHELQIRRRKQQQVLRTTSDFTVMTFQPENLAELAAWHQQSQLGPQRLFCWCSLSGLCCGWCIYELKFPLLLFCDGIIYNCRGI